MNTLTMVAAELINQRFGFSYHSAGRIKCGQISIWLDDDGSYRATKFGEVGVELTLSEIIQYIIEES